MPYCFCFSLFYIIATDKKLKSLAQPQVSICEPASRFVSPKGKQNKVHLTWYKQEGTTIRYYQSNLQTLLTLWLSILSPCLNYITYSSFHSKSQSQTLSTDSNHFRCIQLTSSHQHGRTGAERGGTRVGSAGARNGTPREMVTASSIKSSTMQSSKPENADYQLKAQITMQYSLGFKTRSPFSVLNRYTWHLKILILYMQSNLAHLLGSKSHYAEWGLFLSVFRSAALLN